jgi:ParB/RepB/Spo0J family partition protein
MLHTDAFGRPGAPAPTTSPQERAGSHTVDRLRETAPCAAEAGLSKQDKGAPQWEEAFPCSSRREEIATEPANTTASKGTRRFAEIPLQLIDPDPRQVRGHKDLQAEDFTDMCANVARHGVLQPLLVRPGGSPGRYTLIAGEFRYEAARRAGQATLPCYIEEAPLERTDVVLEQLSENLHRKQLSHLDLARAFHWLTLPMGEGAGLKAKDLARSLGKSEAFISEHRRLLELSHEDQQQLEAGTLSFDRARAKLRTRTVRTSGVGVDRPERGRRTPCPESKACAGETAPSDAGGITAPTPARLDNGHYVYAQYSGRHAETNLTVLITGADCADPPLHGVVRALERHLHFLKLKQSRERRGETP